MKTIITVISLICLFSLSSTSFAKQKSDKTPTGTYLFTIDEVYNELDIFEMDNDTLSVSEIIAETKKNKYFDKVDIDIDVVQLWEGKFRTVSSKKLSIDEFDDQDLFIRIKVK